LVTSARFADINKDGFSDLLIAGEWMPLTILINKKGYLKKRLSPHQLVFGKQCWSTM
jgi:hypothetical protein